MNVDQAAKARDALELEIAQRVAEFEHTTGLRVKGIKQRGGGFSVTEMMTVYGFGGGGAASVPTEKPPRFEIEVTL